MDITRYLFLTKLALDLFAKVIMVFQLLRFAGGVQFKYFCRPNMNASKGQLQVQGGSDFTPSIQRLTLCCTI